MRVIKEGKMPPKEIEKECKRCGCVFAYERGDIRSDQREGSWVICPTCKNCIDVSIGEYGVLYNM